jgi:hypothetical protein
MPARTLAELVAELQNAEVIPRPDDEAWPALISRISTVATIAEIDEETYFYFLEVLPPKFMRQSLFGFAEGSEPLRLFWKQRGSHFCRQLDWDETVTFCRFAGIPLPS